MGPQYTPRGVFVDRWASPMICWRGCGRMGVLRLGSFSPAPSWGIGSVGLWADWTSYVVGACWSRPENASLINPHAKACAP